MVRRTFPGQRCCRQNPGSCASKMGEKCQSYLYAGAGRTKKADHKRKLSGIGDSGRALVKWKQKAQDQVSIPIFKNGRPKRLFGTFGWKSCWQFNHEPELSWKNDAEKGVRMSCSAKMSRRQ